MNLSIPESYLPYTQYAPLFLTSVFIALISTPIVGYFARKTRVLGLPPSMLRREKSSDRRRLEKQPTPLLGGVAVIIPLFGLLLASLAPSPELTALIIAVSILALMGVIDDKYELSGRIQLLIIVFAAVFLAVSAIDLRFLSNPFDTVIPLDSSIISGDLWGFPISIVLPGDILLAAWIIICTIAVKISSGTDGLMEGNSLIASVLFFLLSVRFQYGETATVSIIFAGLLLGFLFFNFYPAKIRTGAAGKSTFGFILAVLSVMSGAKFATAIMILLIPIADFFIVIINRYLVHRPKNPLTLLTISDQTHLHHKLLNLGLTERQVASLEYLLTGILGATALALSGALKAFAIAVSVIVVAGIIIVLPILQKWRAKRDSEKNPPTPEARFSY